MALIYTDKAVLSDAENSHPAAKLDTDHPCYCMKREAVGEKSVFHWTKEQAYQMYKWYCEGWKSGDIETEFGESVTAYDFKDILKASHYMFPGDIPSGETIQEMWDAHLMKKKTLESAGEEKEDE